MIFCNSSCNSSVQQGNLGDSSAGPAGYGLRKERGEQFNDEGYMEKFHYHRTFFLTILKTSFMDSVITLHYQQEHFVNAVQGYQRAAFGQVEIAAAVATSRAAADMTSRVRDTVEAYPSHQQRG